MTINRSFRRRLIIAVAVVFLFTVTGFLVAPPIIRSQLEKRLSVELGRRVTVEKVKMNPYTLALTLEGFAIQEQDAKTRFLEWNRLYVNFDAFSSLWGEWVLSEIALDGFGARVAVNADQTFNFSDLLAKFAPPGTARPVPEAPKPAATRPVRIAKLAVRGAQVAFSDASRAAPFATNVGPLTFTLTEFRTAGQRGAPYRFEAVTEAGERLAWTGTLQADPVRSAGTFAVENIVLAKYAPYYSDRVRTDIAAGTLSVNGGYELSLAPDARVMRLAGGAVRLNGLKLVERGSKEAAVELPEVAVTGIEADALTLRASIARVAVNGGQVRVRRDKDGALNLLAMLQPPTVAASAAPKAATAAAGTAPAATPRPDVTVGEVVVQGLGAEVDDLAGPRPAQLAVRDVQVALKGVTLAEGARIPVQIAFGWAPKGSVRLDGDVSLFPVDARLKLAVEGFELLPLSPYLEQFVNARLTQGAIGATLEAQIGLPASKPLTASVAGDIHLERFGLVDGTHNAELAGVAELRLNGLRASTTPELSVSLEEISIAGPFARVIVNADRTLNLATVLRAGPASAAPAAAAAQPASARSSKLPVASAEPVVLPKIEIGRIAIRDGDYRFIDRSLQPNVTMAVAQFTGTIRGLSSTNPGRGEVDLKAMVDGAGPVAIVGKLDPLGARPAVDLKIDFKNVDLVPLSPYSGRFAGYELARGKLLVDVKLVVDGPKINSTNVVTLNQFTFGHAVQSPDATKLPVRLGVALLKDLDGKIVIDVPVQGNLDDPQFRIGQVVLRVIVNLLTKAAASPFTLLGAAFGGGGDELAFQDFAPGSADLQPAEVRKLETMVKALTNRPALSIALDGHYDAAADGYALKRVKLADQVRRAIWEKKRAGNPNIPPPAELAITAEENVAMIKTLYEAKFPPGTQFGTPLPTPPAVVAPPAAPSGFFKRLVRTITGQAKREQRAAEGENARRSAEHEQAVKAALAAGVPLDEMSARLAEAIAIDDNDLRALAQARAQRVRDYFATTGSISGERLFLAKEKTEGAPAANKGPRVFLTLQ